MTLLHGGCGASAGLRHAREAAAAGAGGRVQQGKGVPRARGQIAMACEGAQESRRAGERARGRAGARESGRARELEMRRAGKREWLYEWSSLTGRGPFESSVVLHLAHKRFLFSPVRVRWRSRSRPVGKLAAFCSAVVFLKNDCSFVCVFTFAPSLGIRIVSYSVRVESGGRFEFEAWGRAHQVRRWRGDGRGAAAGENENTLSCSLRSLYNKP